MSDANSPSVLILPTNWSGTLAITSWGATTTHHRHHGAHGEVAEDQFYSYEEELLWIIDHQDGRHLRVTWKSPRHESFFVGTLSADGKTLAVTAANFSATCTVSEGLITGSGSSRPFERHGEDLSSQFAATTWELRPTR